MLIYNITFHIEDGIHDEALLHLKDQFIAKAIGCGFMSNPRLAYIHRQHEEGGSSYSLQFSVNSIETLNSWLSSVGQSLFNEIQFIFGNKMVGFSTIMEEIEL